MATCAVASSATATTTAAAAATAAAHTWLCELSPGSSGTAAGPARQLTCPARQSRRCRLSPTARRLPRAPSLRCPLRAQQDRAQMQRACLPLPCDVAAQGRHAQGAKQQQAATSPSARSPAARLRCSYTMGECRLLRACASPPGGGLGLAWRSCWLSFCARSCSAASTLQGARRGCSGSCAGCATRCPPDTSTCNEPKHGRGSMYSMQPRHAGCLQVACSSRIRGLGYGARLGLRRACWLAASAWRRPLPAAHGGTPSLRAVVLCALVAVPVVSAAGRERGGA